MCVRGRKTFFEMKERDEQNRKIVSNVLMPQKCNNHETCTALKTEYDMLQHSHNFTFKATTFKTQAVILLYLPFKKKQTADARCVSAKCLAGYGTMSMMFIE